MPGSMQVNILEKSRRIGTVRHHEKHLTGWRLNKGISHTHYLRETGMDVGKEGGREENLEED